ncbi:hypothetical protein HNP81_004819 [Peribacillus huizhouensis]|uniref:Uncharacterized protein n=1 Tax=Peribacillus huizhouensis TaxID=1501239 RepID=A0ABR6CWL7_9BACI|nr:hypothetical protein [Peribacillus huizhouensis]
MEKKLEFNDVKEHFEHRGYTYSKAFISIARLQ